MPNATDIDKAIEEERIRRISERVSAEKHNREPLAGRAISQFAGGVEDVLKIATDPIAGPLQRTFGDITYSPGRGLEISGPSEMKRRQAAGENFGPFGGARDQPQGLVETAARVGGQTLPLSAAVGQGTAAIVSVAPRVAVESGKLLSKVFQAGRDVISTMGERYSAAPLKYLAGETAAGAGAGSGRYVAERVAPDSQAARFIAEILGSLYPSFAPTRMALRGASYLRSNLSGFSRGAARAEQRIVRAVPKPQEAVNELGSATTIDPQTGRPVLSLAQRTGEPGLLALERDVLKASDELTRAGDEQIANANSVIQQSAKEIGGGSVGEAQAYLDSLLSTRIRIAAQRADERIAALGPTVSREAANHIAAEEIDRAVQAAATQRRALFEAIPKGAPAPTKNSRAVLDALLGKGPEISLSSGSIATALPKAQIQDIPPDALRLLSQKSKQYLGDETNIGELVGLQTKLAEVSRKARAAGDRNMARIADLLSEAVENDIGSSGIQSRDAVDIAMSFAADFRRRFKQGTVGALTGTAREGGMRVPAGLTFEQSIGVSGPRAREALDDIYKAVSSDNEVMKNAAENYLRDKFTRQAVSAGSINRAAAIRFLETNQPILSRMPEVRAEFVDAIKQGKLTERLSQITDPKKSKAALLIRKGPEEAFRQIASLSPEQAARESQKLMNLVSRDKTGEATRGLKTGVIDALLERSSARDIRGNPMVSGLAMRDFLQQPGARAAIAKIFSPDELRRLDVIQNDLIKLERSIEARGSKEGIIGDVPGSVLNAMVGIAGAATGRRLSHVAGIGGTVQIPGIMANRFREMAAAGIQDPAKRLITDSMQDEKLFTELLMAPTVNGQLSKTSTRRFLLWAGDILATRVGLAAARSAFEEDQSMEKIRALNRSGSE